LQRLVVGKGQRLVADPFLPQEVPHLALPGAAHELAVVLGAEQHLPQRPAGQGRRILQPGQQPLQQLQRHPVGLLMVAIQPEQQAGRPVQPLRRGVEHRAQQIILRLDRRQEPRRRLRLVRFRQPRPRSAAQQPHRGIVQQGKQVLQGQGDVLALLPQVVGQAVQRAFGDQRDPLARFGAQAQQLAAQRDRIVLAHDSVALRAQAGQQGLVVEDTVRVADQGQGMRGAGQLEKDGFDH
jgi:hypothetical protein